MENIFERAINCFLRRIFIILGFSILAMACKQARKVSDLITRPTPRELYARQFENDSAVFAEWENEFENTFADSLRIELPYLEKGIFFKDSKIAYSYDFLLQRGETFHTGVRTDSLSQSVFVDLYRKVTDSLDPYVFVTRSELNQKNLKKTIEKSGKYKLIVQSGIGIQTYFKLEIYTTPLYSFPVSGKDYKAIKSFWGARRDGGRRSH